MITNCRSKIIEDEQGTHIILDEETTESLNTIVMKTNVFLAEPLTMEQGEELIGSIIDFYFSHSDDVTEFEDFVDYIARFMELLADNIHRRSTNMVADE